MKQFESIYQNALESMKWGNYSVAANKFALIKIYRDADALAEECRIKDKISNQWTPQMLFTAIVVSLSILFFIYLIYDGVTRWCHGVTVSSMMSPFPELLEPVCPIPLYPLPSLGTPNTALGLASFPATSCFCGSIRLYSPTRGGNMEDQTASVLAEEVSQGHCHYAACDDETRRAIEELESGGGTHCDSLEELYRSLDEDD
jgi:hypothetical protein